MIKRIAPFTITIALALGASAPLAHADVTRDPRWAPTALHVNTGVEILGGADVSSVAWRTHVGLSVAWGRPRLRPSIGFGGTFGLGALHVADPRSLSGRVSLGYYEVGPEVRVGLRWVDGGIVDPQVFVSYAYLRTDLDERLMLDAVEGVGGGRGKRASLGVNWAQQMGEAAARTGRGNGWNWTAVLLPQQLEVTWERSCGSDRYGVTLSYGI